MRKTLYLAAALALLLPSLALAQGTETTNFGSLALSGTLAVTGAQTYTGAATFNGTVALGDGGDTVAVNSSAWDISTAGACTGFASFTSTGNITSSAGALAAATTVTGGTGVIATTGNIVATAGAMQAATTVTGGTGVVATTGNIVATAGQVNAGTTMTAGTGITATTGNIVATAGQVNAGTSMTAATNIISTGGDITATNGTVTAADIDGFSGNDGELLAGVPTVRMDIVGGTNSTEYVALETCEAGAAATWTAGGAEAPLLADDPAVFRAGAGAVSITFTALTAVGNATVTTPNGANWDGTGDEYIFMWVMSSVPLTANTLTLTLDDNDAIPDPVLNFPAIPVANTWQLVRLDMSAVGAGDKNVVSDSIIISNHATELQGAVVWIDQMVKVDGADASALGFDVINQPHGLRGGVSFVEDGGNGTFVALVEWTDYFVDYINDDIYWISNQSANNDILLYASAN